MTTQSFLNGPDDLMNVPAGPAPVFALDGRPVFELNHEDPWTLPPAKAWAPAPRELTLKEKWRLNAARKLGA